MKPITTIIPLIGLIAAVLLGVTAGAAAESKSQKLSRMKGQLCTTHFGYLERAATSGAELLSAIDALAGRVPGGVTAAAGRQILEETTLEVLDYLNALDLQLMIASNACNGLAAGRKRGGLVAGGYDETASKSDIIGGLKGELCGLYVDNLAEIIIRGDRILEALAAIQTDAATSAACRSAQIDLSGAEDELRQVLRAVAGQFFASERVCLAIAENDAKRNLFREAEAGLRPALGNPYLVLLLVYYD
jgi:hypothetical protein